MGKLNSEQIALIAQKYLALQPVLVVGSGASAPHGIPTMNELGQHLVDTIRPDAVKAETKAWGLFKELVTQGLDLENALQQVSLPDALVRRVESSTWDLFSRRDLSLYNKLIAGTSQLPLTRLFRFLLRVANPRVSVFTTNYDRLVEYAADCAEADVFTGFSSGWLRRFMPERIEGDASSHVAKVDIWKMHGSLDWFERDPGQPIAIPLSARVPPGYRPLVVTPGLDKYRRTHGDPFRAVIAHADRVFARASSFLCIGYGFNDEHVQPRLVRRIQRDGVPILVLTRTLTSKAREIILSNNCHEFLALEEHGTATMVYGSGFHNGELLPKSAIWQLPCFLDTVAEPNGGTR